MNLQTISLLVPLYKKAAYHGQTPDVYATDKTAKLERALVERCPRVIRQRMGEELFADKAHGTVEVKPHYRYDLSVNPETPALAEIVSLALSLFDIKQITVIRGEEVLDFDADAAEELSIGAHPWCDQ